MNEGARTDTQDAIRLSRTTEWTYLAEGGAHLVFAYRGTEPSLNNKVLRIRKAHLDYTSGDTSDSQQSRYRVAQEYLSTTIISVLVPPELLSAESRVTVEADWMYQLERESLDRRPKGRISARAIPSDGRRPSSPALVQVSVLENLLGGEHDIAIEIKPKCGFLPDARFLSPESKTVKTKHCRFCMHSSLRETRTSPQIDKTPRASSSTLASSSNQWDYCPLDLFSGDRRRRRRAVGQLFDSWVCTAAGGNNFRIYASGKAVAPVAGNARVFGDSRSTHLRSFISNDERPEDDITATTGKAVFETAREPLCNAIAQALDRHTVIPLLHALQQEFDVLGIEELGRRAMKANGGTLRRKGKVFPAELLADPIMDELDLVRDFWIRPRATEGDRSRGDTEGVGKASAAKVTEGNLHLDETTDLRTLLVFHGISAIFKDCSIIIRFPNALSKESPMNESLSNLYLDPAQATIKIIDLDLKPLEKANKWYELDDEIWRAYRERIDGTRASESVDIWPSRTCHA